MKHDPSEEGPGSEWCPRKAEPFPNFVNVEVLRGVCTCRCVHCPVGRTDPAERKRHFGYKTMDLPLFKKIAGEVARYANATLRVHAVGEPLLWPELEEALRIGKECDCRIWVFTSAVTSDRALLDALCECAAVLEVSVNSTDRDGYRATKGVDRFGLVRENIRYMHQLKTAGAPVHLLLSRTQTSDPSADEAFVEYWRASGLASDVFCRDFHTYNGLLEDRPGQRQNSAYQPCMVHFSRMNLSVEGRAVVCFNELFRPRVDPRLIIGDARVDSLLDIWRSEKLQAIRQAALDNRYSVLPFADAMPCRQCTSCQPLSGGRVTSESQIEKLRHEKRPDG